jgi:DNA adenine methylase
MTGHTCENCGKVFKQKSHLTAHLSKKNPCLIEQLVENVQSNENTNVLVTPSIIATPIIQLEKDINTLSRQELITLCKEKKIKGYSTKKREELISILSPGSIKHLSPIIKWSGGKVDEIPEILKYMPDKYDTYLEPFIGGGALYFYLNPKKAVINDIHPDLIAMYKTLGSPNGRNKMQEFIKNNPNTEEVYYKVRDTFKPITDIDKACQFFYLRKTCFRGMLRYNSSGKFNIPYGRYKTISYSDLENKEYEELLSRTTILNGSFLDVFKNYNDDTNFMFLDPPYDSVFTDYGYCSFGKNEHEQLAKAFKETKIKCLMVIGKTDYISTLYKDYIVAEYPKKYRFKIHSGRVGEEINVMHLVIRNY